MRVLELVLLGGFKARAAGQMIAVPGRKERAMLAYLAMSPGESLSRDKLCGLLWSDRPQRRAHDSLKEALFRLRKSFDPVYSLPVLATRSSLALDRERVAVDVVQFEQLIGENTPEALVRATALYHGDLLDGIDVHDPAFEEWLLIERERLRGLAREGMATLVDRYMASGACNIAGAVGRRLLALDPLCESAHRALMDIYAKQGQTALALKQYQLCCDALRTDLGVEPEAETKRLYQSIQARRAAPPRTSGRAPAVTASAKTSSRHGASPARRMKTFSPAESPAVAVLPFQNLSDDPAQQYFSDGVTEDIITELTRFRQLFVIARHSSFQYREDACDIQRIGRELQVQYIVEGSIRRWGDSLRISAQLVDAESGLHLWAERYDCSLEELFSVEDDVTRMIASALAVRIEGEECLQARRKAPENMSAYDFWLRGKRRLDLWTREGNLGARQLFGSALEIDPNFARAHAGLAVTYEWGAFYSSWDADANDSLQKAEHFAKRAVAVDNADPVPHVVLGWIYHGRRSFEAGRRHFDRAIAINPNDADTLVNCALALAWGGEDSAAIDMARTAIRLNPTSPDWYQCFLAGCYLSARQYQEAVTIWERMPDATPETRVFLSAACVLAGKAKEARQYMAEFIRRYPEHWTGKPCVQSVRNLFEFRRKADIDRVVNAMRQAGLPE